MSGNQNFGKVKMKLFKNIIIACSVATGKNPKTSYCDLGELNLPDNAEKWVCGEATGNFIPIRSKCYLECDAGYIATSCKCKIYKNWNRKLIGL